MTPSWRLLIYGLSLTLLLVPSTSGPQSVAPSINLPGQSVTLLPDGRRLLLGGQGTAGVLGTGVIQDPRTGLSTPLPRPMIQPREFHTATVLPDGTVLIVGGLGSTDQVVGAVELFEPVTQTFQVLPSPGLTPRAYQTATLLTDGRIMIAGGVSATGTTLASIDFWDPQARTAQTGALQLSTARQQASATLLSDGTVLIWGGQSQASVPLASGDVVDPVQLQVQRVNSFPATFLPAGTPPQVAASLPTTGATDVSTDGILVLRFSTPMQVSTVNGATLTLNGPQGPEAATVVPAEGGRLAFLTPRSELAPGTTYTLTINGATDPAGFLVPFASLSFTTARPTTATSIAGAPMPHMHGAMIAQPPAPAPGVPAQVDDWQWRGDMKDGKPHAPAQDLPPVQAPAGVTGLAGQVLQLNGDPLPNVTLQIGQRLARTDQTGRFLLTDIPDGYQPMLMMGYTANEPGKTYGLFEYGLNIEPKQTNILPFTIWMPLIDTENAIALPTGTTTSAIKGTTPRIPGLEVYIPAGVALKTPTGAPLTSLSVTPVPLDRTPFPVPQKTLYFIVPQGHGTMVETHDGAVAAGGKGVRVVFPNVTGHPAKTKFHLNSYDAHGFSWFSWGEGEVTADRRQIAAAPQTTLSEIGCAWVIGLYPSYYPAVGPPPSGGAEDGEPVDLATGLFVLRKTDLYVPDVIPIAIRRTYRQNDPAANGSQFRVFGLGSTHDYQMDLTGDGQTFQWADLILPDGGRIHFVRTSPGTGATGAVMQHTTTPGRFFNALLSMTGQGWEIKLTDGTRYQYQAFSGQAPKVKAIIDRVGNTLTITRGSNGLISRIISPNGRWVEFTYSGAPWWFVTQVRDNSGRTVNYQYDSSGTQLLQVTDVAGQATTHTWDSTNTDRVLTIKDPRNIVFLTNHYDANGRIDLQTQADSTTYQFAYTLDGNGKVTQVDVTNPRGYIRRITFNSSGYSLTDTRAQGQPEAQTTTYVRQIGSNLVTSMTDALSRQTTYTYTTNGYLATVTRPGPNGNVTWTYAYESTWNQIQTITDPLNHTTTFGYDSQGNRTTITDPRGKANTLTYDSQGRPLTITDPRSHTWTFTYDGPDLATVTNPLSQTASRFSDAVGRPATLVDPLGNQMRYTWDALNRLTQVTDPLGSVTQFSYDANGNLLNLTDARGGQTRFTPDAMDRAQTRTDALSQAAAYTYDQNGNLRTFTDRKSQQRTNTYDSLDRPTRVDYADGSWSTFTWDAGNRLTQMVDSLSGTITRTPDSLDRLQQEVTSLGTVSYGYDDANRRTSMSILGQAQVTYSYDNANRVTSLTQGAATVTLGYDDASRRTSLTFPNGVQASYAYDNANRLNSITFVYGGNTLGTLTYMYDAAGRRTNVGGTWARTGLPAAVNSASYNANNQQTVWNGQTQVFDLNGNLTSDGPNTYAWDARNRLVTISGNNAASFQYDPLSRRTGKTINSVSTNYLYDGSNPVQELSGSTVLANLLTGLGIDEYFTRTDSSGRRSLLGDAVGSILALSDDAGVVQTSYTYDPFGSATISGQSNGNSFQYTGRENDGAGSYFFRARYYSPSAQRFVREDPVGFSGGDVNLYAYVGDSPVNRTDPSGLAGIGCGTLTLDLPPAFGLSGRKPVPPVVQVAAFMTGGSPGLLLAEGSPSNAEDPFGGACVGRCVAEAQGELSRRMAKLGLVSTGCWTGCIALAVAAANFPNVYTILGAVGLCSYCAYHGPAAENEAVADVSKQLETCAQVRCGRSAPPIGTR